MLRHRSLFLVLIATVIFLVGLLPQLPPWWLVAVLAAIALLLLYRRYWRLACLLLAAIYSAAYGKCLLSSQLPEHLDNQSFHVVGVVKGLPHGDARKQRFHLQIEHLYSPDEHALPHDIDGLIRLSWYHPSRHRRASIEPGQRWQLAIKLRRPRGFANPAGFDYQVHLMSRGMVATGYVQSSDANILLAENTHSAPIDNWRRYFKDQFIDWHQREQMLSLLLALAIGERSLVTADQWALLRNTGTIHLMAISGLHISLAAIIGFSLGLFCSRLWQLGFPASVTSYYLPAYLPALFSMATASLYGLLAGMSLPTQRALIMVLIFHLASLLYRNLSPWLLLSIALTVIALHDPLAVYNQGFWLSFLAVAVLLYSFIGHVTAIETRSVITSNTVVESNVVATDAVKPMSLQKRAQTSILRHLKTVLWSQWVLAVGLLVPGLFWLQGLSVSAPLANSIAVPYVSLVIVPLLLLTMMISPLMPAWATAVYRFTEQALAYLMDLLWLIDQSLPDFMLLPVGPLPWTTLVLAGIAVIWLLSPRGIPYRYLSVLLLLPIAFPHRQAPDVRLTFLDVGQGTAVVVETHDHVLVYDTGPNFGPRFNAGANIIAPYLRYRGHTRVDYLIVSHADNDHAGGAAGLIDNIAVDHIFSGEPLPIDRPVTACQRGQHWQWDGIHFGIVWPAATAASENSEPEDAPSGNNASCVLTIAYKGHRIILAGDIEGSVEKQLLATGVLPVNIDIVLAPHHGSQSSSSSVWVSTLSPQWAVVTAGYNNRYRHPHPMVVDRYLQQGTTVLNTADRGAIQFTLHRDSDWQVITWRQYYRRYWYTQ